MEEVNKEALGRNEPCPCGSGKKYKRCCGVSSAPKLGAPKPMPQMPPGFDPSQMDPQKLQQVSQALQRLPRGQMQRLQSMMQRAMSGQDISSEAQDFERMLPPDFKELLAGMAPSMPGQGMPGMMDAANSTPAESVPEMTEEEAKRLVAEAAAEGKISADEASALLGESPVDESKHSEEPSAESEKWTSKLFRGLKKKG